jgi:triphosphoribosyl-dephospho-CoA synthetase
MKTHQILPQLVHFHATIFQQRPFGHALVHFRFVFNALRRVGVLCKRWENEQTNVGISRLHW